MDKIELKVKMENGFTENVKLPYDINRIDYLHKNTQNWRKDIDLDEISTDVEYSNDKNVQDILNQP